MHDASVFKIIEVLGRPFVNQNSDDNNERKNYPQHVCPLASLELNDLRQITPV